MHDLAESGHTNMAVTHKMGFAKTVADIIVCMAGGQIVEENIPAEFFTNPEHEHTKLFLSQFLNH
jgi:general L-amino acid transport system ATP-binding protein